MSIRLLPGLVLVALLAAAGPASARSGSTTLLYEMPTADVLPAGALTISADMTFPLIRTPKNVNYPEADFNVRFSPFRKLDFALTAYTFADYALDLRYQVVVGGPDCFGLAMGVYDVGFASYVSPVGHDTANAWPDWDYNQYLPRYNRQTERFSAFVVTSIPVAKFARLHLGLGRGRFVGYDVHSKYLNIDYFFDEYHQWAFGLFGGVELYVTPQVALVAEASGRDVNTGVRVCYRAFTGKVAWTKMEGLLASKGDARFGRLEVGLTCQFGSIFGRSEKTRPREYFVPSRESLPLQPEPAEAPPGKAPSKSELRLLPVYFDVDKYTIRPWYDDVLKRNAGAILAKAKAGLAADVIIEGHTCPTASEAHNVDLGIRRAEAAKASLVKLGVDPELLTTEWFGKPDSANLDRIDYYLERKCEFKWKY